MRRSTEDLLVSALLDDEEMELIDRKALLGNPLSNPPLVSQIISDTSNLYEFEEWEIPLFFFLFFWRGSGGCFKCNVLLVNLKEWNNSLTKHQSEFQNLESVLGTQSSYFLLVPLSSRVVVFHWKRFLLNCTHPLFLAPKGLGRGSGPESPLSRGIAHLSKPSRMSRAPVSRLVKAAKGGDFEELKARVQDVVSKTNTLKGLADGSVERSRNMEGVRLVIMSVDLKRDKDVSWPTVLWNEVFRDKESGWLVSGPCFWQSYFYKQIQIIK